VRQRVLRAVEADRPHEEMAARFEVSVPTIERCLSVLEGLHFVASACLELARATPALWICRAATRL
jgi:hypothetical protein